MFHICYCKLITWFISKYNSYNLLIDTIKRYEVGSQIFNMLIFDILYLYLLNANILCCAIQTNVYKNV